MAAAKKSTSRKSPTPPRKSSAEIKAAERKGRSDASKRRDTAIARQVLRSQDDQMLLTDRQSKYVVDMANARKRAARNVARKSR